MANEAWEFDAAASDPHGNNPGTALALTSANGYRVAEQDYPHPDLKPVYASSVDTEGEVQVGEAGYENREVTLGMWISGANFTAFNNSERNLLQKVGKLAREGGTFKRTLSDGATACIFDVVNARVSYTHDHARIEHDHSYATVTLTCRPFWRGTSVTGSDNTETTNPCLIFTTASVAGDVPALGKLVIDEDDADDQWFLMWAVQSRYYDSASSARLFYEAEELTPLGTADLDAGPSGASGQGTNKTVLEGTLTPNYAAVLSTERRPAVRSVGAEHADIGSIQPGLPAGLQENDIMVMYVETANEAITAPTGWAHVADSPVPMTTADVTRLNVLWKRATTSESAPLILDPGDHAIARIVAVSGCVESGDPWDVTSSSTESAADTSVSIAGDTTTVDDCLVLAAVATGTDVTSTTHISAFANADLQDVTEQMDNWSASGNGGGFGVCSGTKVTAGAYGATAATLVTSNTKAMHTVALKPASAPHMSHVGDFQVWARVQTPTANTGAVKVRWEWGEGDFRKRTQNDEVALYPDDDELGAWEGTWRLVNLGQVHPTKVVQGTQRWEGRLLAKSTIAGDDLYVDCLYLMPVTEGYGEIRGVQQFKNPTSYNARDEFDQTAGALTGKTAPVGGTWVGAGDADDFSVETTGKTAQRTAVSDASTFPGGRKCTAGTSLTNVVVQADFKTSAWNNVVTAGVIARYTDTDNFAAAVVTALGGGARVRKVIAGSSTTIATLDEGAGALVPAASYYTIRLLITASGRFHMWLFAQGANPGDPLLEGNDSALATGGTLASGTSGIYDGYSGATATTRNYDNFYAFATTPDAAIFASQSLEIRHDRVIREDSGGTIWTPVSKHEGDYLLIPPAGREGRTTRIIVKACRNDPDTMADAGIDDLSARLTFVPRGLVVPEA